MLAGRRRMSVPLKTGKEREGKRHHSVASRVPGILKRMEDEVEERSNPGDARDCLLCSHLDVLKELSVPNKRTFPTTLSLSEGELAEEVSGMLDCFSNGLDVCRPFSH